MTLLRSELNEAEESKAKIEALMLARTTELAKEKAEVELLLEERGDEVKTSREKVSRSENIPSRALGALTERRS